MDFGNSTEKLLFKIISSIIPKETIDFLQPENLKKMLVLFGQQVNEIKAQQLRIEQNQQLILDMLNERYNGNGGTIPGIEQRTGTDG